MPFVTSFNRVVIPDARTTRVLSRGPPGVSAFSEESRADANVSCALVDGLFEIT